VTSRHGSWHLGVGVLIKIGIGRVIGDEGIVGEPLDRPAQSADVVKACRTGTKSSYS